MAASDNSADRPGTLLTVAPTGAEHRKAEVPALPVTLDELLTAARDCERAGAAMIHLHIRDTDTAPTLDLGYLREAVTALREHTDLIVQLSTGGAVTDAENDRLRVLDAAPDSASCTLGTVNFGRDVFFNRWDFIVELHTRMREKRICPEYEVFDIGHLATLHRLLNKHGLPYTEKVHVNLVMGVPGGMPGDADTVLAALRALPAGASFSATGIGRATLPVMLTTLAAGGHLRVGMEDTLTFVPGQPVRDNTQLVTRAARLATLANRPPLSPAQARVLLGITAEG